MINSYVSSGLPERDQVIRCDGFHMSLRAWSVFINSHLQFSQHLLWFLSGVHHPSDVCRIDECIS